jgi:D-alanyl-D-alanine carboxypeptidase
MTHRAPARTTRRRLRIRRLRAAALVLVVAATAGAVGPQLLASASSTAAAPADLLRGVQRAASGEDPRLGGGGGALGEADGAVPHGTTVFDDDVPGVAELDADLLTALRRAATDGANDGIELLVDSGWRSPAYQQHLLDEAVGTYGSQEEAARWVATPDTSAHVSGDAVDIGPTRAAAWLSAHGAAYGLCRVYANEPWHYELRRQATDLGCPAMYADPTHDPRMQQR